MVASDVRDPQFQSSHRQTFISDIYLFTVNSIDKTKIKKKRTGMAHLKNKSLTCSDDTQLVNEH